jgi:hypothetical protein
MNAKSNAGAKAAERRASKAAQPKAAKAPKRKSPRAKVQARAKALASAAEAPAPKLPRAILAGAKREAAANRAEAKAAKAAKPAKAPKAAAEPKAPKAPKADKPLGIRAQREADALAGILPTPPDFSAPTHKPYRARLEALVALVQAGDIKGLRDIEMIPPRSTSPKALHRYRDLALMAFCARAKATAD